MPHQWLPEHDEHLRERHEAGASFSEISASLLRKFDIFLSRNACIGRAHRVGLKAPAKPGKGRTVANLMRIMDPDVRVIITAAADAEGVSPLILAAQWLGERARFEAEAKARVAA